MLLPTITTDLLHDSVSPITSVCPKVFLLEFWNHKSKSCRDSTSSGKLVKTRHRIPRYQASAKLGRSKNNGGKLITLSLHSPPSRFLCTVAAFSLQLFACHVKPILTTSTGRHNRKRLFIARLSPDTIDTYIIRHTAYHNHPNMSHNPYQQGPEAEQGYGYGQVSSSNDANHATATTTVQLTIIL